MVFICSPYAGCIKGNVQNARQYSRFAYLSGYMPITPHLMYPLFLNDKHAKERLDGMDMGLRLLDLCEELWSLVTGTAAACSAKLRMPYRGL